jgi:PAS domain S-box-containing protein
MPHATTSWYAELANGQPGTGYGQTSEYVNVNRVGITISDETGKIHEANDAYLDIHGYARSELSALNWNALTTDDWRLKTAASMAAFTIDKFATTFETVHYRKDGQRVPLSITVMRIGNADLLLCTIVETDTPANTPMIDPRFAYFRAKRRFGLTEREHQVLELLLDGQSNAEISAALVIRAATVSDHVQSVMRKVDVQSRSRLFKQVILK